MAAESRLNQELFSGGFLVGDNYNWRGVRQAIDEFASQSGLIVDRMGSRAEGFSKADEREMLASPILTVITGSISSRARKFPSNKRPFV